MILASLAATVLLASPLETPIPVKLVQQNGSWRLLRGGKPYLIRGVGGGYSLPLAKSSGANSVRTWGADNQLALLDQAHRLDMTVALGIWLGHRDHGFDYSSKEQVEEQLRRAEQDVLRYRNHPALLLWGLGNEMEISVDPELVWRAVGDVARMVKRLDPNHPTMTVVAEIDEAKVRTIQRLAPDIDILGINSYGGVRSLPERLRKAGWTKPYIVTEFGPRGPWESPRTSYGAALEDDSTVKARDYAEGYREAVSNQRDWALGSYAFLWGHKPEGTPTWFGMVLPSGEMLGAVDAMTEAWTGRPPANHAPKIIRARCAQAGALLKPGEPIEASIQTVDPDGDKLGYRWFVLVDDANAKFDEPVPTEAELSTGPSVRLTAPRDPLNYRLFAVVRDGRGKAATVNWPFAVRP